jgi:hypothetical protein
MPYPEFTPEEKYIVEMYKLPTTFYKAESYMWGYLIGGCVVFGVGMLHQDAFVMAIGLALVVGFRIYDSMRQRHWSPVFHSVIAKFDAALSEAKAAEQSKEAER